MLNWNNFIINQSQRRQKSHNIKVWTKELPDLTYLKLWILINEDWHMLGRSLKNLKQVWNIKCKKLNSDR